MNFSVLIFFLIVQFQMGCAAKQTAVKLHEYPQFTFNQNYKYRIHEKKTSLPKKYLGSQLGFSYPEHNILVQKSAQGFQTIPLNQVEKIIEYTDQRQGTQWQKGLGIGALSGAAIGGIVFGVAFSGGEDTNEYDGLTAFAGAIVFVSTTILGGLTGLLVGSLTSKKKQIIYTP